MNHSDGCQRCLLAIRCGPQLQRRRLRGSDRLCQSHAEERKRVNNGGVGEGRERRKRELSSTCIHFYRLPAVYSTHALTLLLFWILIIHLENVKSVPVNVITKDHLCIYFNATMTLKEERREEGETNSCCTTTLCY